MSNEPKTKFFYAPAMNIEVGTVRRIRKRADGVVKAIRTDDGAGHIEIGFKAHISKVLRVCFVFDDGRPGKLLLPDGHNCIDCPGYGTYMPRLNGENIEWQEL